MYDIISQIINHSWTTNTSEQQYIYQGCIIVIAVLLAVTVDLVYRVFRHFWR